MSSLYMPVCSPVLAVHHFACDAKELLCDPIVLLHGWGGNSNSWQVLLPALRKISRVIAVDLPGFGESPPIEKFTLESVIDLIAPHVPERAILVGWSLGGMLAVQLAVRYPQKISRLITLAANLKFTVSHDYPSAMPVEVNRQFMDGFSAAPEQTLKLFSGLVVQGDASDRSLLKKMRSLMQPESINSNWMQALQVLAQLDNRKEFSALTQPGLHLFGEADVLVPVSAAQSLTKINSKQKITVLPKTAHALHWSQTELVAQLLISFLIESESGALNKNRIAKSFSRAAHTYDSVAVLQRDVGEKLLQKISMSSPAETLLDLGCGTGYFTAALQKKFPHSHIIGLDIAEGMLHFAKSNLAARFKQQSPETSLSNSWICADAEQLPIVDNSVPMIFSSLAFQWCADLPALFSELARVLTPGGQLIFSSLGPNTLHELKSAWQKVDSYVHVNQFHEQEQLLDALAINNFVVTEFMHEEIVLQFERLADLTRSLKALGAHNVNKGQAIGLSGRKKIEAFKRSYEYFRQDGLLPATYDVYYLVVKKAVSEKP